MCVICLPHRSVTSARGGLGVTDHSSGFDSPPHLRPSGPARIVPEPPAGRHLVLRRACVPGCGLLPVGHGSQRPGPWAPQEDQPCRRMAQGRGLLHLRRALCHFSAEAGACPGRSQQGHEPESGLAPGRRPACPPHSHPRPWRAPGPCSLVTASVPAHGLRDFAFALCGGNDGMPGKCTVISPLDVFRAGARRFPIRKPVTVTRALPDPGS